MIAKSLLVICAQALIIKCISGQYLSSAYNAAGAANCLSWEAAAAAASPYSPAAAWNAASYAAGAPLAATWATTPMAATPYATAEWATGYSPANLAASNGGGLPVSTASPFAPTGVALTSENVYEGPLAVAGTLPFLGTVGFEGALPTAGAGAVMYGCGNGNVAMLSEDYPAAGYNGLNGAYGAAAAAELGYGYATAPLAYDAGIAGAAYGPYGYRGCGCGSVY